MTVTPTTTIRVSRATRDRLMRARERDFAGVSVDDVIDHLLDDHAELATRLMTRADAERIGNDPADRAEIAQISKEWSGLDAW